MLNSVDVIVKIKNILHERFGLNTLEMTDATKLRDLGIDSLHLVDVMLDIEIELDITIEDLSLPPETTLGELGEIVSKCLIKS